MRRHLPVFAVVMMLIAVALWIVGFWTHLSRPVIVQGVLDYSWVCDSGNCTTNDAILSDVTVHLRFSSNCSTTIYLKHKVSPYDWGTIEIASNVTSLDTRFVAKDLGVNAPVFTLDFITSFQRASIYEQVKYETPNNFYYIPTSLGAVFAGIGVLDIAYAMWKRRLEAKAKEHVFTRLIAPLRASATSGKSRKKAGFSARFINRLVKLRSLQKERSNRINRTEVAPFD